MIKCVKITVLFLFCISFDIFQELSSASSLNLAENYRLYADILQLAGLGHPKLAWALQVSYTREWLNHTRLVSVLHIHILRHMMRQLKTNYFVFTHCASLSCMAADGFQACHKHDLLSALLVNSVALWITLHIDTDWLINYTLERSNFSVSRSQTVHSLPAKDPDMNCIRQLLFMSLIAPSSCFVLAELTHSPVRTNKRFSISP